MAFSNVLTLAGSTLTGGIRALSWRDGLSVHRTDRHRRSSMACTRWPIRFCSLALCSETRKTCRTGPVGLLLGVGHPTAQLRSAHHPIRRHVQHAQPGVRCTRASSGPATCDGGSGSEVEGVAVHGGGGVPVSPPAGSDELAVGSWAASRACPPGNGGGPGEGFWPG